MNDGYTEFATGRYKLHQNSKTWDEAKETCESEGGHLAVVNSQAEADVLMKVFQPSSSTWAFLGFTDREKEGVFIDIFGEYIIKNKKLALYKFWKNFSGWTSHGEIIKININSAFILNSS